MDESSFPRRVAVLGSSGSIGKSALEVIAQSERQLLPVLLSVHNRTDILAEQLLQMSPGNLPRWVVVTDETADRSPLEQLPRDVEISFGHEKLCDLVRRPEVDVVLSAIVGSAGLTSTYSALEADKTVALANKESLVMGGELLTNLVKSGKGRLIPVDSEHCAIMQALRAWTMEERKSGVALARPLLHVVERIILTASGGPFRTRSLAELASVTVAEALAHPTWNMGKKITIDSATLMNKALEIIEAGWLFDLPAHKIDVVIHPQSLIHSMVEFVDGSVIAQMSVPDMRLPIQLALYYPHRFPGPALKLDWQQMQTLEFHPPDFERFPAIPLGLEVVASGGTAGAVVNAANEVAVSAFLDGRLPFQNVVEVCKSVLSHHQFEPHPTLEQLLMIDRWARSEAEQWIR
ncbi:MAG: 1-deoxy-D-xylulose-5-phosphate reductoisomerase [Planctomycetaceae bacterium]|nr:1-deoxy-D-xylulose-5-phosphate reductoisomerase [Planctomycetaceae bacterium]